DSIPIMKLDLSGVDLSKLKKPQKKKKKKERVEVVRDEGLDGDDAVGMQEETLQSPSAAKKKRRNILERETGLAGVSLDEDHANSEDERRAKEEVERLRREIE